MGEFILILIVVMGIRGGSTADSVTATSILFPSKEACEAARVQTASLGTTRAVCVPRGTP
jgi:hypothetical protein